MHYIARIAYDRSINEESWERARVRLYVFSLFFLSFSFFLFSYKNKSLFVNELFDNGRSTDKVCGVFIRRATLAIARISMAKNRNLLDLITLMLWRLLRLLESCFSVLLFLALFCFFFLDFCFFLFVFFCFDI